MVFSPDSRFLAVSAKDTTVLLVDVRKVLAMPLRATVRHTEGGLVK
jgi:hypothetical protein